MRVWNLIFSRVDIDDWRNAEVAVMTYGTLCEANAAMTKEFNAALKDAREEESLDLLDKELSKNNRAEIQLGYGGNGGELEACLVWSICPRDVDMTKKAGRANKTKRPDSECPDDKWRYKVRCAMTLAHYRYVDADNQDEAEDMVREDIEAQERTPEGFDWYGEASHLGVSFEVEEA